MDLLFLLIIFCLFIGWSIWLRILHHRTTASIIPEQLSPKPSPLSMAVQELVSTAGGVYLSVIMLTSFLRIETPERIMIMRVAVDPIALFSIVLAIIQPAIMRILKKNSE